MRARFARLLLVHMAGNAALAAAVWYWLAVPDRSAGFILVSALLALAVVFGFVWLEGAALAAFRAETSKAPFRSTLRRIHVAALGALAVLAGPALAIWSGASVSARAGRYLLWIAGAAWFLAAVGWIGGRAAALRSPRYWLLAAGCLAAGILLPYAILSWVPGVKGLPAQAISLAVRLLIAWAIAVAAWLGVAKAAAQAQGKNVPAS